MMAVGSAVDGSRVEGELRGDAVALLHVQGVVVLNILLSSCVYIYIYV